MAAEEKIVETTAAEKVVETTAAEKVVETTTADEWVELTCAFCQGTGRDPFGLLSVLSTCGACRGSGKVRVKRPYVPCRACGGTGIQPFTRLYCLGCGGKGVQSIPEGAMQTCPVCEGAGVDGVGLYCQHCHGIGEVPVEEEAGKKADNEVTVEGVNNVSHLSASA